MTTRGDVLGEFMDRSDAYSAMADEIVRLRKIEAWVTELAAGDFISPFKRAPLEHARSHIATIESHAASLLRGAA